MSIGISENFRQSFAFTKENLLGKILNWVILFVLAFFTGTFLTELFPNLELLWAILTIAASVIMGGIIIRIYAGGEVTFASFGTVVIKGIGYNVAALVYSLPALILTFISVAVMLIPLAGEHPGALAAGIGAGMLLLIAAIIVLLITNFLMIPAAVNYAHSTGVGGAFKFSEIFARLEKAGWGETIGSYLIFLVIGMLLTAVMYIPAVGGILYALAYPFLLVLQAKYFANLLS